MRRVLFLFTMAIPFTDASRSVLGGVSLVELLLVVLGLHLLIRTIKGAPVLVTPGALLAMGLSALAIAAYLWATTQGSANLIQTAFWIEYGLIYLMVMQYARDTPMRDAALLGLWAGAILAGVVVLLHWGLGPEASLFHLWGPEWAGAESPDEFRAYGPFNNPLNMAGYFAAMAGASSWVLAVGRSRLAMVGAGLTFAIFAAALVASGSKIVLFVLVVCGFLLLRRPILVPVFVIGAIGAVVSGYADTLVTRLANDPLESSSVTERVYLLSSFTRMIADRPVLGYGAGNFQESYYEAYMHPLASLNPRMFTSENVFLEIAVQMGMIGALLFLALVVRSWWLGMVPTAPASIMGVTVSISPAVSFAVVGFVIVGMIQSMASPSLNYLLFSMLAVQEVASGRTSMTTISSSRTERVSTPGKQGSKSWDAEPTRGSPSYS